MSKTELIEAIDNAINTDKKYFAYVKCIIDADEEEHREMIIFGNDEFDLRKEFFEIAYDEALTLKNTRSKIVGFIGTNKFNECERFMHN